jgi:hypothetical protein
VENSQFSLKYDKNIGTLRVDQCISLIVSRILRMRNISDKHSRENQGTRFVFRIFFFENLVVYSIMWKNMVEPDRPQMTIRRRCTACWIPKTTATHSECVIFIVFPLQQWLHEHTSVLCYTYIACLVLDSLLFCNGIYFRPVESRCSPEHRRMADAK